MTHTIEKTRPTQLTITVSVPYSEIELLLPKAAEKLAAEIEIEGFRKGKAPYEVVKQKLGEFKILEEAARMHIRANFKRILDEAEEKEFRGKSFEPVGEPQVAITKLAAASDFEYKITLFVLPPLELPDYKVIAKKIMAGKKVPETSEKEVESAIEWLRESRAKLITVNRGAENGDRIEVSYSGKLGGVKLEGLQSENHPLILGKHKFIPGFEEELLGMRAGEEKSFALAVPQDYHAKDIAGKNLEFAVKTSLVQERQLPEWNDTFAKSLGNFSFTAEVEKSIRSGLQMEKEEKEKERLRIAAVEAIADGTQAEIPEPLVEHELEKMVAELQNSIERMGLKYNDYLAHLRKTADDLRREWRQDARRRVKIALVLREIAKEEKIAPSDEDVQAAVNRTAAHRGLTEENLKAIDREQFFEYNRGVARNEKVFKFLESLA